MTSSSIILLVQEAAYQARVAAAGKHTPPAHFGRPKVQWFY